MSSTFTVSIKPAVTASATSATTEVAVLSRSAPLRPAAAAATAAAALDAAAIRFLTRALASRQQTSQTVQSSERGRVLGSEVAPQAFEGCPVKLLRLGVRPLAARG
jgi:hypothetical protein